MCPPASWHAYLRLSAENEWVFPPVDTLDFYCLFFLPKYLSLALEVLALLKP